MERKLTRFLTLLISLLVLVSVCTTAVFAAEIKTSDDPKCYLHGDVNGDGKLGTQDAIYALYYAMWHDVDETLYPMINQEFDFTGDGKVSTKDALYLLWASVGDENYALEGDIHEYYKPNWTWAESEEGLTATLTFRCGCGELIKLTAAQEDITAVTTAATCVASGKVEYTAKVTYEGVEYTTEKPYVVEIPATAEGHNMVGTQNCVNNSVCSLCGHTLPALGHSWVLSEDETKTYAATCTEEGQLWYDCACGEHYTVEVGTVPHVYEFFGSSEPELKDGTTCTYVITNTYKCVCGEETTSTSEYDKHSYKAVVTQEATCVAAGVKTYICENCGDENGQTETIPVNADAHNWNDGIYDEVTGIITYTCSVCGGEKTAVTVTKDEAVSKEQLANELQLENANVSLDEQTIAALEEEKEIKISITEADLDNTGLSEEQKEQVGDNTVYDFSMTYTDGTSITSFAGKVKVSLPYTLGEGEDIDSIDIWYIDDEGNPAQMKGTYANGYVTFETDHFSYYTVTRLTPAQRCERYGHIWVPAEKAATCTEEGYTKDVCQRCGSEANVQKIAALEHKYTDASDAKAATCTETGLKHQICERCNHEVKEELVALGHNLVVDEANSWEADCSKPGKVAKCCERDGCDYVSVEEQPQLKHDFGTNPLETVYPDCTTGGYDHQKCDLCGQDVISNETAPLGHDYGVESWNWSEDKTSASAKLVCKINPEHTVDVKAVVSVKNEAASCTGKGYVTYTALISHNKKEFTKTFAVETEALGHQTSGEWETSGTGHYRICSVCGEKADQAGHTWNESVIKEPTCAAAGTREDTCIICGYTTTVTVPATGKHNLVGGECLDCGFTQDSCEHIKMAEQPLDLSGYDICDGTEIFVTSCACGENQSLYGTVGCAMGEETTKIKKLPDGTQIEVTSVTCTECGLTVEYCPELLVDDEEICRAYYGEYYCLSQNGQMIVETVYVNRSGMMYWDHPTRIVKETIDLSTLGLCGGTLELSTCDCGVALGSYLFDGKCNWTYENGIQTCTECGTIWNYEHIGESKEGCNWINTVIYTFEVNGQTVYTYEVRDAYAGHDNDVVKYVMDGESCEDGITIYTACADCGYKDAYYCYWHEPVIEEVTDLTGYGSCATASHQFVCACGAEKMGYESYNGQHVAVGELAHDFELVSEDPETGTTVYLCSKCNYTQTIQRTQSEKDEDCCYTETNTVTYTDGKGHTYSYVYEYESQSHNYQQEIVLKGTTCNDGIEVRWTCTDCGSYYIQNEYYGHMAFETQRYDLTQYGMCGGEAILYECPCGTYAMCNHFDQCKWEWLDGDEYTSVRCCRTCGVTMEEKWETLYKITDCLQRTKVTTTFSKDGEELLEISYTTDESTHRSVYSFELLNPEQGCEGGYRISETCLTCGMEADWGDNNIWYYHENFPVAREIVSVNQLCGDLELVTYSCPCGLDSWVNYEWSNGSCNFQWVDNNKYICTECGAVRTETRTSKKVEGEACKQVTTYGINIVRNGKEICDFSYDTVVSNHKEVASFNLLGDTCDDGYTVSYSCAECGKFLREWTNPQYGCDLYTIEVVTVASHEDICNDVVIEIGGCACGQRKTVWENNDYGCEFEHIGWDGINQRSKYQCRNCGLIWYNRNNQEHIKGTCTAQRTIDSVYEWNGEVIGTYQDSFVAEDHQYVATFELWGETCDDGYMVYQTCVGCGRTESWEDWGHSWYQTAYYDLSDYGMCDGGIWTYGCACGKEDGGYGWDLDCEFEHKSYDDATGTSIYYCSECRTYRYDTEIGQRDPATCTYTGTRTISFVRDDETLLTIAFEQNYESHEMVADSVTLVNPEGTCEDGVIVNERCEDCGYSQTRTHAYHEDITTLRIDLSDGCGGELRFGGCACGENTFFHQGWECRNMEHTDMGEQDENGVYHHHYQNVCPDCGLVVEREYYYVDSDDACETTRYDTYTITYGGETYVHDNTDTYESHDNVKYIGGALDEDSISCEDGVWIQWQCPTCGAIGEDHYGHHAMIAGESIDLGEYGSYCGATLDLYSCACGELQKYDIGEDSECDVYQQHTEHWIDNVLHTTQDTSNGYIGTYSYAYLFKCAVSDPVACGMTIRMAEYWLNEGCMAVEYQTWQLGYDEKTGTYDREITIATGEKHAYHPYVRTEVKETLDDGSTKTGYRLDCPDCGSYAYQYDYWDQNGLYIKFECRYVNTMYETNGENRERYDVTEYGYVANSHNYETYRKEGYILADGSEVWQCYEYADYDFSNNDCKRTRVYTDSDGYTETREESAHIVECQYYNDPEPTCSQNGIRHHVHDCVVCGKEEELHDTWELDPTCHYWYWDSEKQVYVCSECELESAVGATGSITLEDLTDENSDVYTIGYWNEANISYVPMVSVILDDRTEDKEFVLNGIAFNYLNMKDHGVRALTFSKAEAQTAAEAAIANLGYSGSYAIRISFVPDTGDNTLDYAITFDSQNTAQ